MKKLLTLAMVAILAASLHAAEQKAADLPAFQRDAIAKQMKAKAPRQRVVYAKKLIAQAKSVPASPNEKTQIFVSIARTSIANAGPATAQLIATIFTSVPVEYLPAVANSLRKNFDQQRNNLSDQQYKAVTQSILSVYGQVAAEEKPDAASVRKGTLVAMLSGASKNPEETSKALIATLPLAEQGVVSGVVAKVAAGDTEAIAAAAGVDEVHATPESEKEANKTTGTPATGVVAAEAEATTEAATEADAPAEADADTDVDTGVTDASVNVEVAADEDPVVNVPLIGRDYADYLGQLGDMMMDAEAVLNGALDANADDFDGEDRPNKTDKPLFVPTLPGEGTNTDTPGNPEPIVKPEPPKPYSGQEEA